MTSCSRNSRTACASSGVVGTPCAMSGRRPLLEQQQHVVLLLPHSAADRRQFDRALVAGQVPPGLVHAAPAPPHGAVDLPPADDFEVDPPAADACVACEQILVGAEAADRPGAPEAPGAHAEVAEVLHRIPPGGEVPVPETPGGRGGGGGGA